MQKLLLKTVVLVCAVISLITPTFSFAQEVHQDLQGVWKAKVLEVLDQRQMLILGTETETEVQTISVEIKDGQRSGEIITFENDYIQLKEGQSFFLNYYVNINGIETYYVRELDRRGIISGLIVLFAVVVLLFGKMQGLRSLLSLVGSFSVIIYVLLPLLLQGYSPIVVSILVGSVILFVAIFFTHGFNLRSLVAFLGTVFSIIITGLLAFVSIKLLTLTGFASDEAVYLNFSTNGLLDFKGLLLGGMIIGVLGVLDDIAITQVSVVSEIQSANNNLSTEEVFSKALNVGKEHVSALVNTIVLAYAGVSLPLLLWFSQATAPISTIINNEIFATEIARTVVGSIGLILTVPITTFLAVWFSDKLKNTTNNHIHHH